MMKQKLIVTLWRGQLDSQTKYESIFCRLTYAEQEQSSQPIATVASLTWKETFIFSLSKQSVPLRLDFINMHDIKQIHFAEEQVLDGLAIGRSQLMIELDNSNRGTVPAKLGIFNAESSHVGSVFLQYEILKTQVTYVVEKLIDYQFLLSVKSFKLTFIRPLSLTPTLYLKFLFGQRMQKEDFPFEEKQGVFCYNYPVKFFIKNEPEMTIQIQIKDKYRKDYKNPNISFDSQSIYSNNASVKSRKSGAKKNALDIESIESIKASLDLGFKKDGAYSKKIPVCMVVKNVERQIGSLEIEAEVALRTKKQKQQYEIQKKRQNELKNSTAAERPRKKSEKRYQIPKNGRITINSIIGKLELFNEEVIKDKDASIELKLGKVSQNSVVLPSPGKEIIWMDTFIFKRTWEENIKFVVYIHTGELRMPKYYATVNLRDLFQVGRYMAKKLELKDEGNNYCGYLVVDILYKDEQEKPKQVVKRPPEMSAEQKQQLQKEMKKQKILQRMKLREENKKKRDQVQSTIPTFSQKQLLLPPLRSSRNLSQPKTTLSPKRSHNLSVNLYNNGGTQIFSKSPRFQQSIKHSPDSFLFKPESDFEPKKKKGAFIGYGDKFDFTKEYELAPGVGRYQIPSVWDKYK